MITDAIIHVLKLDFKLDFYTRIELHEDFSAQS